MTVTTWLKPGELAARSGVAVSTLHYYEQLGILRSRRTTGDRREYRRDALRIVAFVKTSQRLGISLARIREALATLPRERVPNEADWARIAVDWRADLDDRIRTLEAMRDALDGCIGCGCLSLEECPVRNPGDVLAERGAGPQRLPMVRNARSGQGATPRSEIAGSEGRRGG